VPDYLRGVLPTTEEGLYFWLAALAIPYVLVAAVVQIRATDLDTLERELLRKIFEAVVFATSTMVLIGLMDAQVLKLIGDTKPFLFIAGIAGFFYSIFALRPRKAGQKKSDQD
jgi:hypothetical protein